MKFLRFQLAKNKASMTLLYHVVFHPYTYSLITIISLPFFGQLESHPLHNGMMWAETLQIYTLFIR